MNWEELRNKLIDSEHHYFHTDSGVLLCGDCLEVMCEVSQESIDFVFTSPPYNLGIKYEEYNDNRDYTEYLKWCKDWGGEIYRILKPDGRFCLNHYLSCGTSKFRYAPLMDLNWIFQQVGFKHHGLAIWWDETISRFTAWGSWLSASAPYINSPLEGILILFKNRWKRVEERRSTIEKNLFMELTRGIWRVCPETRNRNHPSPFPVKLVEYALKLLTFEEDVVLDPFIGSGTTAVACEKLNRKWIGIEISEKYCEIARERILGRDKNQRGLEEYLEWNS